MQAACIVYLPRMLRGNEFGRVCVCVCMSCVRGLTVKCLYLQTNSFSVRDTSSEHLGQVRESRSVMQSRSHPLSVTEYIRGNPDTFASPMSGY